MNQPLKIWRSPYSRFGKMLKNPDDLKDETITAIDAYSDEQLSKIAENGFNAIWIYGILHNIVHSPVFPELGVHSSIHLKNIQKLIDRAAAYQIKVFILLQPPRALDVENKFWKSHPYVGGQETDFVTDDGYPVKMRSLCTSKQEVKEHIFGSARLLAERLPDLGGIILITASEYPSHCYGKAGTLPDETGRLVTRSIDCPLCMKRTPAEVISEIIKLIRDGIKSAAPAQEIIAWSWSWSAHYSFPYKEIIDLIPGDVTVMADMERGGEKIILGKKRVIDEYSLSYPGPSEQFTQIMEYIRQKGIKGMAKLQIGTTHELATVPNLPLIGNLYKKARFLRKTGIKSFLGCWNFGNMLSANTAAFNYFLTVQKLDEQDSALATFAEIYFPGCNAKEIVSAWNLFAEAMDNYPFATSFLYSGPLNYALSYPLIPGPVSSKTTGRSWLMDERGDNLESSLSEFSLEEIVASLELLTAIWYKGLSFYRKGLEYVTSPCKAEELNTAEVCYRIFKSGLNIYKVYKLKKDWDNSLLPDYKDILKYEISNLKEVLPFVKSDKRFGFHSEAHDYMFDATSIEKKIIALTEQL